MSTPDPKRRRLAERPRAGTCEFADRIARCAIHAHQSALRSANVDKALVPLRTVLAAFVLHDELRDELTCVALGVGTKTSGRMRNDDGKRLCDCHAEVMARRGFKRFVLEDAAHAAAGGLDGKMFEVNEEKTVKQRNGVSLHLYVSSAPCGNACVRRWAKGKRPRRREELGTSKTPSESHEKLSRSAVDSGQVGLCVKVIKTSKDEVVDAHLARMIEKGELAVGTAPACGLSDESLTCSDKLCVWNIVGYQGALGRAYVRDPVYVKSITVGRKFSEPHLARAMCCRAHGFRSACGVFETTHPALMETAVVFDNVPMDVDEGAVFENPFALVWYTGNDDISEVLNGKTGTFLDEANDSTPSTSRAALFKRFKELRGDASGEPFSPKEYAKMKREADPRYNEAKTSLFKHPRMFEPRRGCVGWHEKRHLRWSGYKRIESIE
ncbi:Adenosine deaminase/editase [Ostreococcus tauri]|uniref:Adenosine deaminase/editase n=1 Tax=Ostreococcus tauri TaxID=70448 RepID=A0A090MF11_OSTTA|nr:Adenosine deaminase/editase [Ostreococcus tauri]CEG01592.1 Adenosine deaminase/editase [Ostreococcus tauri]|eukprot:XP_003080931.2 Adenosine deaminase/editase [Ostreococcus tauri]